MDITKVTHSDHASELCNAVALSQKDHKLARLKRADNCNRKRIISAAVELFLLKAMLMLTGVRFIDSMFKSIDEPVAALPAPKHRS